MKRTISFLAVSGLIAAGVLLALSPWSGDGPAVQKAVAGPSEYGLCNVSVRGIPEGVTVAPFPFPVLEGSPWRPGKSGELIFLLVTVPLPEGQVPNISPDMSKDNPVQSNALVNAVTGEIVAEGYLTPADEAKIRAVLATLRVGSWHPVGPAWPRTDTPPAGEIVELHKAVRVPTDYDRPGLKYRMPEAGSGIIAGRLSTLDTQVLRAYTCDSIVEIDAGGTVLRKDVVPDDEAMFQRFLEEVQVP